MVSDARGPAVKIGVESLTVSFSGKPSLRDVTLDIPSHEILSIIGPANSGKTTFLKTLNRLIDFIPTSRVTGRVLLDGRDVREDDDPVSLRRQVGIIFALPVPLPTTVFENVVYGLRRQGKNGKKELDALAEKALTDAYLWDEIKDRLDEQAMKLSGGQQQRLCIARTLAVDPQVILFDEPCSALDPISTAKIEEAMLKLKKNYTIVLVTNNTKQAARVGDRTAFFLMGSLVEMGLTSRMFTSPRDKRTDDYISGRFG
ncbi:MAG: phosphate ABC transporter ATP-binding protein [Candidatus Omnitrophica bacterium]|nr:phosphate ABC transporter ATP-binding protein [Candidatus Omnitrophota bacterium]